MIKTYQYKSLKLNFRHNKKLMFLTIKMKSEVYRNLTNYKKLSFLLI